MTQDTGSLPADHAPLAAPRFVGRERELALIWNQYKAARSGYARVILLSGEPGIGKTRLLDEVATRASQDGTTVLRGDASESEGMPPYLPFLEALGQYIRVVPPEQLREQVAVAPHLLASILPELAERIGDLPEAHPLPPEQIRLRLYEAIGTFLERISAPSMLVFVLDDLHWADTASLDLLCHIVRHHAKAKLLILGAYQEYEIDRNPAFGRALTELAHQRVLIRVALEPLSSQEIEALALSDLGGSINPAISQLLFAQSEGNPFFAEELLRFWTEAGALVQKDSSWFAVGSLTQALPRSIVETLHRRFARLSPASLDHLHTAAIIGRTFDLSLLSEVEGQEIETVEESLLEAVHAGLIRTDQSGVFAFNHDKIRESLYTEVTTSRRQRLHETIGRALEHRYEQERTKSTGQLAGLALHFTRSNDRRRGVIYAQQAAEQALKAAALEEAVACYHMALELLDAHDERRGSLLLELGEAALLNGEEHEAVAAYEEALGLYLHAGEREAAVRAAYSLGLARWHQQTFPAARAAFEQALELLGNDVSAHAVRVLVDLATVLTVYMDQQIAGATYARQALEMAHRLADPGLIAMANRANATNLYSSGYDLSSGLRTLEQALAEAEARADLAEAAECSLYLAHRYYWTAEIRRSYDIGLRRIEFIERGQRPYLLRDAYGWLALLHASQGAWSAAEQALEQAQSMLERLPESHPFDFLRQVRGFLAYQQEDYTTAERELRAALPGQQRSLLSCMFYTSLSGLAQAAPGKREETHTSMTELETLLAGLQAGTLPTAPLMTSLALIAIAAGDQMRVANIYPNLTAFQGQHYWFLVDRVLGEMAILRADWEKAMMHLTAAEATAQREDLRPELARVLLARANLDVARGGPKNGIHAATFLKYALDLFEELGMTGAVSRIRSRLRMLTHRSNGVPAQALPADLTRSEVRVLQLVARGKSNRRIAQELGISEKTVANHLSHIFNKTNSENRAAATAFAIHHGLA